MNSKILYRGRVESSLITNTAQQRVPFARTGANGAAAIVSHHDGSRPNSYLETDLESYLAPADGVSGLVPLAPFTRGKVDPFLAGPDSLAANTLNIAVKA